MIMESLKSMRSRKYSKPVRRVSGSKALLRTGWCHDIDSSASSRTLCANFELQVWVRFIKSKFDSFGMTDLSFLLGYGYTVQGSLKLESPRL